MIAVLTDPSHTTARGLLGFVTFRGHWQSPDAISGNLAADENLSATLAEYNRRRAHVDNSADSHWKIAMWCEQHGLKPEATAHLMMVVHLDPSRETVWKRLGYRKQGGAGPLQTNWPSRRRRRTLKRRQTSAGRLSWPGCGNALDDKSKQSDAMKTLETIADCRAVPSVMASFAAGDASHQEVAVQVFGQIDSPGSTRALALLALAGKSAEVRSRAIKTLRRRDPREIASFLVVLLRDSELHPDPILYHYRLYPAGWETIGSLGYLFVQGPLYDVLRTYPLAETRLLRDTSGFVTPGRCSVMSRG